MTGYKTNEKIKGIYKIHAGNYDWGCSIDKAIITLEKAISKISAENLSVTERKMVTDESTPEYDMYEAVFDRTIVRAYLCDEEGRETEAPSSRYFAIELFVSPVEGTPFVCTSKTQIFIWSDPYELQICGEGLDIDPVYTKRTTDADIFQKKSYISKNGTHYDYAAYVPEMETDTLFVWLHGLGEGQKEGSDAYLPLLGRKGTTMAGDRFQNMIGGAHVLAPQCPTYWMDSDGKESNFADRMIHADGTSYYTESLNELIDEYALKNGCKKIVLAGCSNGGYMCLVMAMNYPEKYSAVIPICEAVPDAKISDEGIRTLADVPLYFVYSKDDPVVMPELHEIPTIRRLKEAGCRDLHVSETEHVTDTSGKYKNEDGTPYTYMGHLSWIYYDNNETDDGTGLSAWEWIAEKLRGR